MKIGLIPVAIALYYGAFPVAGKAFSPDTNGSNMIIQIQSEGEQGDTAARRSYGIRPPERLPNLPRTRWQHRPDHAIWTRAALSALKGHGQPLVDLVPADVGSWCPAYEAAEPRDRRAFWVGFLSALAKYESTYRAEAVGGGGRWFGLLQIQPSTARSYQCSARSGAALRNGAANLSCAVRIMARTVTRDGVIHGYKNSKGQGVTADWGPMHSSTKRQEMAGWLKKQNYCKPIAMTRPRVRPAR